MSNWINMYPRKIYASVILKDNKIKYWKVGENRLSEKYNISALKDNYKYQEVMFISNNDDEHNRIFEKDSIEWLKQWEFHEEFKGDSPFINFSIREVMKDIYEPEELNEKEPF